MVLTLKVALFGIATIIFFLDFLFGFAGAPYEPYRPRVIALAFALMAFAFTLWAGGK